MSNARDRPPVFLLAAFAIPLFSACGAEGDRAPTTSELFPETTSEGTEVSAGDPGAASSPVVAADPAPARRPSPPHCHPSPSGPPPEPRPWTTQIVSSAEWPPGVEVPRGLAPITDASWGDGVHAIARDPRGDVFVLWRCDVRWFPRQCANQGPGMPGCDPVPEPPSRCHGAPGIHLERRAPNGMLRWTRVLGSSSRVPGEAAMAIGANGEVFVAMHFTGTFATETASFERSRHFGTVVVAYAPNSREKWAREVDGPSLLYYTGPVMAADARGGVALGIQAAANEESHNDVAVHRFDETGALAWSWRTGGPGYRELPGGLAVAGDGSVYVSGTLQPGAISDCPETSQSDDVFVAALAPDGIHRWTLLLGGPSNDNAGPLALAEDGVLATLQMGPGSALGVGPLVGHVSSGGALAWVASPCEPTSTWAMTRSIDHPRRGVAGLCMGPLPALRTFWIGAAAAPR